MYCRPQRGQLVRREIFGIFTFNVCCNLEPVQLVHFCNEQFLQGLSSKEGESGEQVSTL
jgi:hypothetical protein